MAGDLVCRPSSLERPTVKLNDVPVEFGAINLVPAETVLQFQTGLYGALIIEPEGATWVEDAQTRAAATVTLADGRTSFRDLVALWNNDVQNDVQPVEIHTIQGSVNFRSEMFSTRAAHSPRSVPANPPDGYQKAFSNSFSSQPRAHDPFTPVFVAPVGMPTRFRMLAPGSSTFTNTNMPATLIVQGHGWKESPFVDGGRKIGDNPLSQRFGAQQLGAYDAFNFVIPKAGGSFGVTGDYLFHAFQHERQEGTWGTFRVQAPRVVITRADVSTASKELTVQGYIAGSDGSKGYPATVQIASAKVNRSATDGTMAVTTVDKNVGTATVGPDGTWSLAPTKVPSTDSLVISVSTPASSTPSLDGLAPVSVRVLK